jgi:hypothetical protein
MDFEKSNNISISKTGQQVNQILKSLFRFTLPGQSVPQITRSKTLKCFGKNKYKMMGGACRSGFKEKAVNRESQAVG